MNIMLGPCNLHVFDYFFSGNTGRTLSFICNRALVSVLERSMFMYHVDFVPQQHSTSLKKKLVGRCRELLGEHLCTGDQVFIFQRLDLNANGVGFGRQYYFL